MSDTTEQKVSVTILPGPFEVSVAGDYILVTDTRGGKEGWDLLVRGAKILCISNTTNGSAPGIVIEPDRIQKDLQVGGGGSTGGQWLFGLDREPEVTLSLEAKDLTGETWTVKFDEANTKVFYTL